jgi:two-component system sensor histidine kinase TctE
MNSALPISHKLPLRVRMMRQVLLPLALTWLLGTVVTVAVAYYFAQKAFDRSLLDDAYSLVSQVRERSDGVTLELSNREMSSVLFDVSETVYFVVRRPDGSALAGHPGLRVERPKANQRVLFGETYFNGQSLRTVSVVQPGDTGYWVTVAQTTRARQTLLRDVLYYSVAPQIVLLLLLAYMLKRNMDHELTPVNVLQRSVEQRDALDLTPVLVDAPSVELEHLALAINDLLDRLGHSLRAQREFSGNVAHELRTPLAGIRALAEYGLTQHDPGVWREQLARIASSESRASRLVEQLLALALADEADTAVQNETLALDAVVRETVLRYLPRADAAGVDLGVHGLDQTVQVRGNVALIEGLLGNLIDNALRYGRPTPSPEGGASVTVTLEVLIDVVRLSVVDNGPGLSAQERTRLMQRGVRGQQAARVGQGAGLGLAIVNKFAQLMGARFELRAAPEGAGLCATVEFERSA